MAAVVVNINSIIISSGSANNNCKSSNAYNLLQLGKTIHCHTDWGKQKLNWPSNLTNYQHYYRYYQWTNWEEKSYTISFSLLFELVSFSLAS